MIYLVSISSKNILEYSYYNKIIEDINSVINIKDKVIIVTSARYNSSENLLEDILKLNINTSKTIIDTMLSLKELESASYLSLYLDKNKINNILLMPHQIPLVTDNTIDYIEMNNVIHSLTKCQYLVIPGNFGITRKLDYNMYNNDVPESLSIYIYKELVKRKYKVKSHLYKPIEKICNNNELIENIKFIEIDDYKDILERYIPIEVIDLIKLNKLTISIGNKFLQGTYIIGN